MNLEDNFYFKWQSLISNNDINKIHNHIEKNYTDFEPEKAKGVGKITTTKRIRYDKLFEVDIVKHCFESFILQNNFSFGFNLHPPLGAMLAIYNVYDSKEKGQYDWHIDASYSGQPYDVKLTAIINLSKSFEGGELQLNNGTEHTIDWFSKPGSMIMFRSHTLHRVLPVTKGTRRTLTFFLEGPCFI